MNKSKYFNHAILLAVVAFGLCLPANAMTPHKRKSPDEQNTEASASKRPAFARFQTLTLVVPSDDTPVALELTPRTNAVSTKIDQNEIEGLTELCRQIDLNRWLDSDHTTVLMKAIKKHNIPAILAILQSIQSRDQAALYIAQISNENDETALSLAVSMAAEDLDEIEILAILTQYPISNELRQRARIKALQTRRRLPEEVINLLLSTPFEDLLYV